MLPLRMHPGFENPFGKLLIGARNQETQILFCFLLSASLFCSLGFRFLMDQRGKKIPSVYNTVISVAPLYFVWYMYECVFVSVCVWRGWGKVDGQSLSLIQSQKS